MTFRVVWRPEAERRLTDIWTHSRDRAAVTRAAHQIDDLLRTNPKEQGESRDSGRHVLLIAPLGVYFRVQVQDQLVNVIALWEFHSRRHDELQ